jgi:phosphohistidine phosphatase
MKTLIVMRHGHAENWAATDFARCLTADGLTAVGAAAAILRSLALRPDLILSSSAARALQTAERVAAALGIPNDRIMAERSLYHMDDDTLLREIRHTGDEFDTLMMVGHNPAVSALASGLTDEMYGMRPAGFAVLTDGGDSWGTFGERISSARYF